MCSMTFGTARYHFILTDTQIRILKKANLEWAYTFVDARGSKKYKFILNPALAKAGFIGLRSREGITIGKEIRKKK